MFFPSTNGSTPILFRRRGWYGRIPTFGRDARQSPWIREDRLPGAGQGPRSFCFRLHNRKDHAQFLKSLLPHFLKKGMKFSPLELIELPSQCFGLAFRFGGPDLGVPSIKYFHFTVGISTDFFQNSVVRGPSQNSEFFPSNLLLYFKELVSPEFFPLKGCSCFIGQAIDSTILIHYNPTR